MYTLLSIKKIFYIAFLILLHSTLFAGVTHNEEISKLPKSKQGYLKRQLSIASKKKMAGNYTGAKKVLLRLKKKQNYPSIIPYKLGLIAMIQKRPKIGISFFKESIKINPEVGQNHAALALCHIQLTNIYEAKRAANKALRLGKIELRMKMALNSFLKAVSSQRNLSNFHKTTQGMILSLLVLFLSIILHEIAHGYMALKMGDPTARDAGRLSLNPLVHIDLFGSVLLPLMFVLTKSSVIFGWAKPVPINPDNFRNRKLGNILVAIAGPATNILLMLIGILILKIVQNSSINPTIQFIGFQCMIINMVLFVLNLLPIPPLDGSHVVANLLPPKIAEQYQKIGIFGMLLLFFMLNSSLFDDIIFAVFKTVNKIFQINF